MSTANPFSANPAARPRAARVKSALRRGRWLTGTALGAAGLFALASAPVAAAPNGGVVVAGSNGAGDLSATIAGQGTANVVVNQSAQKAVINWSTFSNSAGEVIQFNQPNASAITLNRVTGGTASVIEGTVKSVLNGNPSSVGGQVWVLNPNGMLIGATGAISARGFVATTAGVTDADFLDGDSIYNFTGGTGASVINQGQITTSPGGYAVLAGRHVENQNLVQANFGRVVLAGVPAFTLDIVGDGLLTFEVNEQVGPFGSAVTVNNLGTITAQGGRVLMTARTAAEVSGSAVNMRGFINAQTARIDGNGNVVLDGISGTAGEVVIDGGATAVTIDGVTQHGLPTGGIINVNSQMTTGPGAITVLGDTIDIGLTTQAKLLATGLRNAENNAAAGGRISIGKGLTGTSFEEGPLARAIRVGNGLGEDANGFPFVEIQAASFGGDGSQGGEITLATAFTGEGSASPSLTIGGYLNVESDQFFPNLNDTTVGIGGENGIAGTINISGKNVTVQSTGVIDAGAFQVGGTGGHINMAGTNITIARGSTTTAVGGDAGGNIAIGGGIGGTFILGQETFADTIVIGDDSGFANIFASGYMPTGTTGGTISIQADRSSVTGGVDINGSLTVRSVATGGSAGSIEIGGRDVSLRGTFNATGVSSGGSGGAINVTGDVITVGDGDTQVETLLTASGASRAGTVSIGGGDGGLALNGQALASTITINPVARIETDGYGTTNGGTISLWSDRNSGSTTVLGKLYARSGLQGGNGGVIEAGGGFVRVEDDARLDTTATVFGGDVRLLGRRIDVDTNPSTVENPVGIFAWGLEGGGEINVGAGVNGWSMSGQNIATNVNIGPTSRLNANAINTGNGGLITIWTDPYDPTAVTLLGGSLAADSTTTGGIIEVGGYDIRFGTLQLSALGAGSNIRIREGVGYGYGGDDGFGQAALAGGGPVGIATGDGAILSLSGDFETQGGDFSINAGDDADISFAGFLGTNGGNFELNAGASSNVDNFGTISAFFDATGGSIVFNVGADSDLYNYGILTTDLNSIALTAGDGSFIGNYGSISSNGGTINLAVGGYSADTDYFASADNYGDLDSGGGAVVMTGGNGAQIGNGGTILSRGGDISFTVGDAVFIPEGAGFYIGGTFNDGIIDTRGDVGGDFTAKAGSHSSSYISGEIVTGGGNVRFSHGANSRFELNEPELALASECGDCIYPRPGYIDAGTGSVELAADKIIVRPDLSSLETVGIFGGDIRLDADSVDIAGPIAASNSLTIAPRTVSQAINIGGLEDIENSLSLTDAELDNIDAPTVVLGRADGTGAANIFVTPDQPDMASDPCDGCSFEDSPSTTIIQAGGAGGTITVHGQGETDDLETIRLVAGSNITLAEDFGLAVLGKLELVSGGSFINLADADALTTAGNGQWLVYTADPSLSNYGGLLSGQTALWGQSFANVAANGLAHSGNRYAFGLAPTVTVTALNRTKTYGGTLDLSSPAAGSGFTASGFIDAAQFGGVFLQDSLTGAPSLASSGVAATADAGSYSIIAGAGPGFSVGNGYNLVLQNGTLTVDPRLLTASLTGLAAKTYDGTTSATLSSANYSLAGFVNSDDASVAVANTAGVYDSKDAGTGKTVTVTGATLTGAKAGNYVLASSTLSGAVGTITPKALTAALVGSTTKVYDATTAATLSAANYSLAGFVDGEGGTVGGTSGSYASPNVGSNLTVNATLTAANFAAGAGTNLGNYLLPTAASGAIGAITPATLAYVADPATRDRGTANPAFTGSVTGFVGNETQATATTGTLAFTTTATPASPAGTYAINGGGLTASNYIFVQAPGNASALRVNEGAAPVQQVTTTVIQQVTTSTRTPTPTPAPTPPLTSAPNAPGAGPGGPGNVGTPGSLPPGGVTPPPPPPPPPAPPPPPPAPTGGTNTPPPPGPSVEATPPSPVGDSAPPTPSDSADQGDPVLAEAETEEQEEAPSEKRQLASTTVVVPGVNVEVPTSPRPPEVPGADQSFSGSGNPAQW